MLFNALAARLISGMLVSMGYIFVETQVMISVFLDVLIARLI